MTVDKFGRRTNERGAGGGGGGITSVRGPKGDGFTFSSTGNYDMLQKRLENVGDPVNEGDAANLKTIDSKCLTIDMSPTVFSAKKRRIADVAEPEVASDCATKDYIDQRVNETVTHTYLNKVALVKPSLTADHLDARNVKIINIAAPEGASDVASKGYVDNHPLLLKRRDKAWHMGNRRLTAVAQPVQPSDCVNLEYITNGNVITKVGNNENDWDVRYGKLKYVQRPAEGSDAVNLEFLQDYVLDMAYEVYKQFCLDSGRIEAVMDKGVWESRKPSLSWSDMFKLHK